MTVPPDAATQPPRDPTPREPGAPSDARGSRDPAAIDPASLDPDAPPTSAVTGPLDLFVRSEDRPEAQRGTDPAPASTPGPTPDTPEPTPDGAAPEPPSGPEAPSRPERGTSRLEPDAPGRDLTESPAIVTAADLAGPGPTPEVSLSDASEVPGSVERGDRAVDPGPASARPAAAAAGPAGPEVGARSDRWWRIGFPVAMVALVLAIPVLLYTGGQVVLNSNEGTVIRSVSDPAEPGWEAVVDPTPTRTLAIADADGDLDHVVVQMLTGEASGGVVVIPADTVFESGAYGAIPLDRLYANGGRGEGGAEAIRGALESIVGIGITEIQIIEPTEWAALVGPVAPLTVNSPDAVSGTGTDGAAVSFPKGSLALDADEVWPYLSTSNSGEDQINRLVRVEAFWSGWLNGVAATGDAPSSVPGEVSSGLGYFVRSLAKGRFDVSTLPVAAVNGPNGERWFKAQEADVRDLVAKLVPFPSGPLGERLRLRVLDGTGEMDHGLEAAVLLAANGGQIDKVGNANAFGVPVTQFVYYDEARASEVQHLRGALGVGELVRSEEINVSADATVVLGDDYLQVVGASDGGAGTVTASIVSTTGGGHD